MIKELAPDTIDDLLSLAVLMHEENSSYLVYDADYLRRQCEFYLTQENVKCFLAYKDNNAVGFIVCFIAPYLFSPQLCARQELWFVKKEYRGSTVAYKLIRHFEAWAKMNGAVEIYAGVAVFDGAKAKRISEVLSRMGYRKVGYYHRKLTGFKEADYGSV